MSSLSAFPRMTICLVAVAMSLSATIAARAQDPSEILLEVVPSGGDPIQLTRAELEALPQIEFETTTVWTEGSARYRGPRLSDVLALADLQGGPVETTAANDYKVTLPPDLVGPDFPIVALRINGQPFGLRQLGPLWIVYPYDSQPEYQSEKIFAASVWQLIRITAAKE